MTAFPLFDSLSHPTLDGSFLASEKDTRFGTVSHALRAHGFVGGCAIGMHGVGGYEHRAYLAACRAHDNLFPVAGFDPAAADPRAEAGAIAALGFTAIKVHPRLAKLVLSPTQLGDILAAAAAEGLTVFLCTYNHAAIAHYPATDPLSSLVTALQRAPDAHVVLVHGGDVRLLEYAQLVRHNENLLLDLSFTALKYRGSSVDLDVAYLCENLDRRVCVGVDHPDFDHAALRARFDQLCANLDPDKARNVGYRNLASFLGVTVDVEHARLRTAPAADATDSQASR